MNQTRVFEYLEKQEQAVLLELLQAAYEEMTVNQRNAVFGKIAREIPPPEVDGEELLGDIQVFCTSSLAGNYYAPFDVNSKNFMNIPEETDAWFEELGDYLRDSSQLTAREEHALAVECFGLLYHIIDKMEDGEEIVFAEELGGWMIPGDEKEYITAYLTSLAAISLPEEFVEKVIPLVRRDSYESFVNKVYPTALGVAYKEQKALLKAEVTRQHIRTTPR